MSGKSFLASILAIGVLLGSASMHGQNPAPAAAEHSIRPLSSPASLSILEIMELAIVPASDALRGTEETPTEAQWKALEQSAVTAIVSSDAIKRGGSEVSDGESQEGH